jgi:hypothetical protein
MIKAEHNEFYSLISHLEGRDKTKSEILVMIMAAIGSFAGIKNVDADILKSVFAEINQSDKAA